jgi:hypothetical protein
MKGDGALILPFSSWDNSAREPGAAHRLEIPCRKI